MFGIPLIYRIFALILLVGAISAYGYRLGYKSREDEIVKLNVQLQAVVEARKQDGITYRRQTAELNSTVEDLKNSSRIEYVEKVKVVYKDRVVYVDRATNDVPNQYTLSSGWVYLHDQAAQGLQADRSKSADPAPSGVADKDALSVVVDNYSTCREKDLQILALKDYIQKLRKAFLDFNARRAAQESAK